LVAVERVFEVAKRLVVVADNEIYLLRSFTDAYFDY